MRGLRRAAFESDFDRLHGCGFADRNGDRLNVGGFGEVMKTHAPLREHERCTVTGFVDKCRTGFWWCNGCNHVVLVTEELDYQDDSRVIRKCGRCDSHRVKWCPPVITD